MKKLKVKFELKISTIIGILLVLGIAFTGYLYFQATQKNNVPVTGSKFEQYAQQLGMNVPQFSQCLSSGKYADQVKSDQADGIANGVQGTPAFLINNQPVVGAQPYSEFQAAIQSALASNEANKVPVGVNPSRGNSTGSVVIVEFSDFQCPFCSRVEPTIEQVIQNYPQVKLYYRNFPLSNIHPFAEKAAQAAECANEQGKFWEYHDMLFAKQNEWTSG